MIRDIINKWVWEPVETLPFEGDWVDGNLVVDNDERFICDVVAGFDLSSSDEEYDDCVWLVRNRLGAVQQDTSGAMCVYITLPTVEHYAAKPYVGTLINEALGNGRYWR